MFGVFVCDKTDWLIVLPFCVITGVYTNSLLSVWCKVCLYMYVCPLFDPTPGFVLAQSLSRLAVRSVNGQLEPLPLSSDQASATVRRRWTLTTVRSVCTASTCGTTAPACRSAAASSCSASTSSSTPSSPSTWTTSFPVSVLQCLVL